MLTEKEHKVLMETRLRNLERKYSRVIQHADLTDIAKEIKTEINTIRTAMTQNRNPSEK